MQFRIQSISGQPGRSSYFVETSYGNIVLFADRMDTFDYEFYKSRGGVYLQYLESYKNLDSIHSQMFERLGATGISIEPFETEPDLIAIRNYCASSDPEVKVFSMEGANIAILKQKDKKIWVLGNDIYFSRSERLFLNADDVTDKILAKASEEEVSLILCSWHESKGVLDLKP